MGGWRPTGPEGGHHRPEAAVVLFRLGVPRREVEGSSHSTGPGLTCTPWRVPCPCRSYQVAPTVTSSEGVRKRLHAQPHPLCSLEGSYLRRTRSKLNRKKREVSSSLAYRGFRPWETTRVSGESAETSWSVVGDYEGRIRYRSPR